MSTDVILKLLIRNCSTKCLHKSKTYIFLFFITILYFLNTAKISFNRKSIESTETTFVIDEVENSESPQQRQLVLKNSNTLNKAIVAKVNKSYENFVLDSIERKIQHLSITEKFFQNQHLAKSVSENVLEEAIVKSSSHLKKEPIHVVESEKKPHQTKGIIIFSGQRSGSSFIGELFNQHPDAFYSFEPLLPIGNISDDQYINLKLEVLHRYLKCDFPPMSSIVARMARKERRCTRAEFCFRIKTKELCGPDFCPTPNTSCGRCGKVDLHKAMDICKYKKMSVVKIIRLYNFMSVKEIILDPTINVKVIHLVRDPRGIENSRKHIRFENDWSKNTRETCKFMLRTGSIGLGNRSDTEWLRGRYMKVRYEDLASQPIEMTKKIYQFAGLKLLPSILHWLDFNTNSDNKSFFSTRRKSIKAMQHWREDLSFRNVLRIQRDCKEMLTFFGYKIVSTKEELTNFDNWLF